MDADGVGRLFGEDDDTSRRSVSASPEVRLSETERERTKRREN